MIQILNGLLYNALYTLSKKVMYGKRQSWSDSSWLSSDCPNSGLIIGMDLYVHEARRPQRLCRPQLAGVYEVGWSKEDTMNAFLKHEQ